VAKSIVKSDNLLATERRLWLKSIVKSDIPFSHRAAVAKSIVKSDILLATVRRPWLKSIVKSAILISHRPPWLKV
jgi:hypothetical protein